MKTYPANIKVVGVGGGGNNAIDRMVEAGMQGVEFIAVNTDMKSIVASKADKVIQIGIKLTKGLGAGAIPEVGEKAALENEGELRSCLAGADMVFLTAGMGGGTGTGATPIIASIAKAMGILTVGIVTKPFPFEGRKRMTNATSGIEKLKKSVDSLIVILNGNLLKGDNKRITFVEAFISADEVLKFGIQGISNIINIPGMINLDFADVSSIMKNSGIAHMGMGIAKGDDAGIKAAKLAVSSPLLETSISGATGLLVNITGGPSLSLIEINEAVEFIREQVDSEAEIIFGAYIDEGVEDEVCITLIATGLDTNQNELPKTPVQEKLVPNDKVEFPSWLNKNQFKS
ncbi:MAG: cell division protein FtsZ [Clostridiaceae bacterium]|nr:cell division protein FtsZ [Clostridiaceae bacterium]